MYVLGIEGPRTPHIIFETTGSLAWGHFKTRLFAEECRHAGVEVVFKPKSARSFGPELIVSVIGGVSVFLIGKLIDHLVKRFRARSSAPIFLVHRDVQKTFCIPQDTQRCLKHFENYRPPKSSNVDNKEMLEEKALAVGIEMSENREDMDIQGGGIRALTLLSLNGNAAAARYLVKRLSCYLGKDKYVNIIDDSSSAEDLYLSDSLPAAARLYVLGLAPHRNLAHNVDWSGISKEFLHSVTDHIDVGIFFWDQVAVSGRDS